MPQTQSEILKDGVFCVIEVFSPVFPQVKDLRDVFIWKHVAKKKIN